GDEVRLRSARLGRRVLPRLSSAHNFEIQGHDVYRFLCELQVQGTSAHLGWDWGPLVALPFLPRVVSGRVVLAPSRWWVGRDDIRVLAGSVGARRLRAVRDWKGQRGLPRWVKLAEGDNQLPIDLENALMIETLVELIKARESAVLTEMFPGPDDLWASGP